MADLGTDDVDQAIIDLLARDYGLSDVRLDRFSPDHPSYLVTAGSARRVVRIGRSLHRHAAALTALETADHPAPRILPTIDRNYVSELGSGTDAIVVSYLAGTTPKFTGADLRALGTALGRLHRDGSAITDAASRPGHELPVIERAGMLPDNELRFALRQLLAAEDHLPDRETATQWQRLVDACRCGLDPITGLTQTFLHGDAHPWNSIIGATGQAQYIDWDSAGPGPAVIDLAFLVVSCATGGLIYPYVPTDPAAVDALLDGYRSQLTLSATDLDALDGAVAFRVLVSAGVGFGQLLQRGEDPLADPGIQWSLRRLEEAPRIADTIRAALSR